MAAAQPVGRIVVLVVEVEVVVLEVVVEVEVVVLEVVVEVEVVELEVVVVGTQGPMVSPCPL